MESPCSLEWDRRAGPDSAGFRVPAFTPPLICTHWMHVCMSARAHTHAGPRLGRLRPRARGWEQWQELKKTPSKGTQQCSQSWRVMIISATWDKPTRLCCPQTSKGQPIPHPEDKGPWLLTRPLWGKDEPGQDLYLDPALVPPGKALLCAPRPVCLTA